MILGFIATKKDIDQLGEVINANAEDRRTEDERLANELGDWTLAQLGNVKVNIDSLAEAAQKSDASIMESINTVLHHLGERLDWYFDNHIHSSIEGTNEPQSAAKPFPWEDEDVEFGTVYVSNAQLQREAVERAVADLDEMADIIDVIPEDDPDYVPEDSDEAEFLQEAADARYEGLVEDGSEFGE